MLVIVVNYSVAYIFAYILSVDNCGINYYNEMEVHMYVDPLVEFWDWEIYIWM